MARCRSHNGAVALFFVCALALSSLLLSAAEQPRRDPRAPQRLSKIGWKQTVRAAPDARVRYTLALKHRNLAVFESLFLEITNPKSGQYGQYLSIDEVMDIIAPVEEDVQVVLDWLESSCQENQVTNLRDVLKVETTVSCVEQMFDVKMYVYRHSSGYEVIKTQLNGAIAELPEEIQKYVQLFEGLTRLPVPRHPKELTKLPAADEDALAKGQFFHYVIPETVRSVYSIPNGERIKSSSSSQSVIEFLPVGAPAISDLQKFTKLTDETFTNITKIVGPFEVGGNGESTLDIQYLSTVAPGAANWYITIADGWQYEFALELFNTVDAPWINSVSYGWPEEKSCQTGVTHANCKGIDAQIYIERSNVEFQKVGSRGISVIVCSQDEGAPSEENEDCQFDRTHPLWPIYPSSSPWVTTVGATTVIDSSDSVPSNQPPICANYPCATGNEEYPCMINNTLYTWTTGGGFSNWAPRPSYQEQAVQTYLSSGAIIPPSQFFNMSNRGYPDVSAMGARILIVDGGEIAVTAGTSASTPIFAAIMSLLNDYRLSNGKPPLGFLNPLLYQMAEEQPQSFKPIVLGNNKGTIGVECKYGYGNSWGWSPTTGLGTPNYAEMLAYIQSLSN